MPSATILGTGWSGDAGRFAVVLGPKLAIAGPDQTLIELRIRATRNTEWSSRACGFREAAFGAGRIWFDVDEESLDVVPPQTRYVFDVPESNVAAPFRPSGLPFPGFESTTLPSIQLSATAWAAVFEDRYAPTITRVVDHSGSVLIQDMTPTRPRMVNPIALVDTTLVSTDDQGHLTLESTGSLAREFFPPPGSDVFVFDVAADAEDVVWRQVNHTLPTASVELWTMPDARLGDSSASSAARRVTGLRVPAGLSDHGLVGGGFYAVVDSPTQTLVAIRLSDGAEQRLALPDPRHAIVGWIGGGEVALVLGGASLLRIPLAMLPTG